MGYSFGGAVASLIDGPRVLGWCRRCRHVRCTSVASPRNSRLDGHHARPPRRRQSLPQRLRDRRRGAVRPGSPALARIIATHAYPATRESPRSPSTNDRCRSFTPIRVMPRCWPLPHGGSRVVGAVSWPHSATGSRLVAASSVAPSAVKQPAAGGGVDCWSRSAGAPNLGRARVASSACKKAASTRCSVSRQASSGATGGQARSSPKARLLRRRRRGRGCIGRLGILHDHCTVPGASRALMPSDCFVANAIVRSGSGSGRRRSCRQAGCGGCSRRGPAICRPHVRWPVQPVQRRSGHLQI